MVEILLRHSGPILSPVSRILYTGEVYTHIHPLGKYPLWADTLPGKTPYRPDTPGADTQTGQTPPGRYPLGRHPWGRHPRADHPPGRHPKDDHFDGRYASYWNAFLSICHQKF